jgi:hypothetical protein
MAKPVSNASAAKLKGRIGKLICSELNGNACWYAAQQVISPD